VRLVDLLPPVPPPEVETFEEAEKDELPPVVLVVVVVFSPSPVAVAVAEGGLWRLNETFDPDGARSLQGIK